MNRRQFLLRSAAAVTLTVLRPVVQWVPEPVLAPIRRAADVATYDAVLKSVYKEYILKDLLRKSRLFEKFDRVDGKSFTIRVHRSKE